MKDSLAAAADVRHRQSCMRATNPRGPGGPVVGSGWGEGSVPALDRDRWDAAQRPSNTTKQAPWLWV